MNKHVLNKIAEITAISNKTIVETVSDGKDIFVDVFIFTNQDIDNKLDSISDIDYQCLDNDLSYFNQDAFVYLYKIHQIIKKQ